MYYNALWKVTHFEKTDVQSVLNWEPSQCTFLECGKMTDINAVWKKSAGSGRIFKTIIYHR